MCPVPWPLTWLQCSPHSSRLRCLAAREVHFAYDDEDKFPSDKMVPLHVRFDNRKTVEEEGGQRDAVVVVAVQVKRK